MSSNTKALSIVFFGRSNYTRGKKEGANDDQTKEKHFISS